MSAMASHPSFNLLFLAKPCLWFCHWRHDRDTLTPLASLTSAASILICKSVCGSLVLWCWGVRERGFVELCVLAACR